MESERRKNDQLILEKMEIIKEINADISLKIQELEERRNANLQDLKHEIFETVNESINKIHIKPSKETMNLVNDVKNCLSTHIETQSVYERSTTKQLLSHGEDLKEIKETLATMAPSYKMLNNVAITGEVLTRVGKFLLTTVIIFSTIIGSIYAFKNWINKP